MISLSIKLKILYINNIFWLKYLLEFIEQDMIPSPTPNIYFGSDMVKLTTDT